MNAPATFQFEWGSRFGCGTALFLTFSGFYVFIAALGLIVLHTSGPASEKYGEIFLGPAIDGALFGKPPWVLMRENLGIRRFALSNLSNVCGLLLALGTSTFATVWFALRRGEMWALWTCVVGNGAMLAVYWFLVMLPAIRFTGVGYRRMYHPYAVLPTVVMPIATCLCWLGSR
jgi:hypothetical protein